jgi:hypothetical protein
VVSTDIEQELHHHLEHLPAAQQRQVLDFARTLSLTQTKGVKGSDLLCFAETISKEDLAKMQAAIEADCEQVDANDW